VKISPVPIGDDVLARSSVSRPSNLHDWLRASLQPAPVLCVLMIVILWTILPLVLVAERQRTQEFAIQQGGNLVRLFEQNTASMLSGVDRTLLLLRQQYEKDPAHFDFKSLLQQSVSGDNLTTQFAIADEHGDATALIASDRIASKAYFGDRQYFQKQRDASDDRMLVGGPLLGKFSNRQSIILSRRLRYRDGSFAGVIGAAVDPKFIEDFYKSIDIGAGGNVVLRDLDGVILASAGTSAHIVGRQFMQPVLRVALAKSPSGYFWGTGAVDGVGRLVFYRRSANVPVVMTVGLSQGDVFASYARTRLISIAGALLLTALLLLGTITSVRHQVRLGRSMVARLAVETNLAQAKAFLDTIIENLPLPVIVKDPKTLRIQLVNRAFEVFTGVPRDEVVGTTSYDFMRREDADLITKRDREAAAASDERQIASEFTVGTRSNGLRTIATTRLVVRDSDGGPSHLIAMCEDVTDRREFDSRIFYMAHHDALTGLANRTAVAQKIEDAAARQRQWGHVFTVLLLDLDRFKHVNDTLGHSSGDLLLREVADRLRTCLRETDVLARLGGDEFVVIQGHDTDQRAAASTLANHIVEVVDQPFNIDGNEIHIGATIGIALAPEHAADAENLLKMADMALYCAKSEGRGGHRFFSTEMIEAAGARREIETELRYAMQNGELELHYQPIVDAKTCRICAAEALLRWRHPTKGIIFPDQFIPLAEETGLIKQIGAWVLQAACGEAAKWPADIKVAVNLSPVQFRRCNLAEIVADALDRSGLPPQRLEFEITETALIENAAECLPILRHFNGLGIGVALDDFGTGYSSLSQLTMFPFDKIKIDKSFTRNVTKRSDCAAIIAAVTNLAQSLNITTTAEGVETAEQYRILRLAGVTSMQGYLFALPGPAAAIDFEHVYGVPRGKDAA
jgi:diguanylate cyclase (GGDEF)-like protein/PAS domain S-box-containing protein